MEQNAGQGNYITSMLDYLFFGRVKETLGGRLQYIGSGAAPLPKHVEEFLRVALTAPLIQGYGLSESGGMTFATLPHRHDLVGTVGVPLAAVEFRLESVPEMNYDAQGNPPAGEICLRGPCMFSEYYKNPEEYRKAVDRENFFHTGDIAELHPTGALKIIDRKKNIFKLAQGEYVAVEKIESILVQASPVKQIWVYGDSFQRYLVAIVHPSYHRLKALLGDEDASMEALCGSDVAKKHILEEMTAIGRGAGLKGFECVRDIALTPEEFTIENGMLTPAHKLKRHDLLKKYKDVIDTLYAEIA